jgi:hypothetical protein
MTDKTFLHQLMTLPTVIDARLSPDKRWVAFAWYRIHANIDFNIHASSHANSHANSHAHPGAA